MRDAVTYFDQCYAMADKTISLEDVEKTLGLISDADLDEIISAVQAQDRTSLSEALGRAFRSGLSSISIAEALISRLRDMEFGLIKKRDDSELARLENLAAEVRKIIVEMQYSGVPDIILEMALMKIAAPRVMLQQNFSTSEMPAQIETLDDIKKVFRELRAQLPESEKNMRAILQSASVLNFAGNILTLNFSSPSMAEMFKDARQAQFEEIFSKLIGHPIKVAKVIGANVGADFDNIGDREKKNMQSAGNFFQTDNFIASN